MATLSTSKKKIEGADFSTVQINSQTTHIDSDGRLLLWQPAGKSYWLMIMLLGGAAEEAADKIKEVAEAINLL